jgi:hypothetical protein
MHCDQHLNKMIVESAQMLSTVLHLQGRGDSGLMKPAYQNHPCTRWIAADPGNFAWVVTLAKSLEAMRDAGSENAASAVIRRAEELSVPGDWRKVEEFVYAGLQGVDGETVQDKYRSLYRAKWALWKIKLHQMTYRHRPVPQFMADLFSTVTLATDEQLITYYGLENIE